MQRGRALPAAAGRSGTFIFCLKEENANRVLPPQPEQKPDLIQSQIRFSFLYREKVGIISGNGGNSNFYFLYSSVYGDNAAAGNDRGDGMENPTLGKIKIRISQYNRNQLK